MRFAPKPEMSNQAGIAMPMLSVTGRVGAVGQTNLTWSSCTAGAMALMLAPLLPSLLAERRAHGGCNGTGVRLLRLFRWH